ncbi:tetratricopeptide repeat protein [Methanothrix soehngenii]
MAWGRKGEFLGLTGKYNESLQDLERAIELIPAENAEDIQAWSLAKVSVLHAAGQIKEALIVLDNVTTRYPQNKRAWSLKGNDLAKQGMHNESLTAYDVVLKLDPQDADAWNGKARQLAEVKRYNESLQAYEEAIRLTPSKDAKDLAALWRDKGDLLNNAGREDEARSAFQMAIDTLDKILQDNSKDAAVWLEKGNALQKLGEYNAAVDSYNGTIKHAASSIPGRISSAKAWIGMGDALSLQGRNREALEAYEKAIELHPNYGEAWLGRGEMQKAEGDAYNASLSIFVAGKLGYTR